MIPAFPRWIWPWLAVLALVAGFVNAVAILSLLHEPATHLTGLATAFSVALSRLDGERCLAFAAIMAAFATGAALSGVAITTPRWQSSRRHGVLFLIEALSLIFAAFLLDRHPWAGTAGCAFAVGIQNGASTHLSGGVLRTSHVTGMFTDLSVALGQKFRNHPWDQRRVTICAVVVGSFTVGGICGAAGAAAGGGMALIVPAIATAAIAAFHLARANHPARPEIKKSLV
jgi:uncharacterized membrane protein YoaK (UPF0700 family)